MWEIVAWRYILVTRAGEGKWGGGLQASAGTVSVGAVLSGPSKRAVAERTESCLVVTLKVVLCKVN